MLVIQINHPVNIDAVTKLEVGQKYVYSDRYAQEIMEIANREQPNAVVEDPIRFEYYYCPYDGRPLNDKTIFIWRTGGGGDLLMLTPALKYIKTKWPSCKIKFSTDIRYADLLENHPFIDEVLPYPINLKWLEESDFHLSFENLIEQNPDSKKLNGIDLFLNKFGFKNLPNKDKQAVVHCTGSSIEHTNRLFEKAQILPTDFIVGIQFTVKAPIRQYPSVLLVEAAKILVDHHGARIVWFGDKNDVSQIDSYGIAKYNWQTISLNMAKEARGWQDSLSALSKCDVAISADSSTLHMAGAYKYTDGDPSIFRYPFKRSTPMVGIYGPFFSRQRIAYYPNAVGLDAEVGCAGCNTHGYAPCYLGFPSPCFRHIQPDHIVANTMRLVALTTKKKIKGLEAYAITEEVWKEENKKIRQNPYGKAIAVGCSPLDRSF